MPLLIRERICGKMPKTHSEYLKVFDEWRSPVRGRYSMYFEYNHHKIGHNPVTDPMAEWDSKTSILYMNYQIIPDEELDERETIKKVRNSFHQIGIPYSGLIVRLEPMWTRGYCRYKFTTYFKVDHLPTKEEMKVYEGIFKAIEIQTAL